MAVWVDDIFIAHGKDDASRAKAKAIWAHLQKDLDLGELQECTDCLACAVVRDRPTRTITLNQTVPINNLLERASMGDCSPADTPVAAGFVFTKQDCPATDTERLELAEKAKWYCSTLASCIYFAMWTRPDIAFAISKLSKFSRNPGIKHVQALKRLLRYLKGTANRCLVYSFANAPPRTGVYGYFDAAHADDADTLKTTMAYVFFFEGCAISWKTKLHTSVTLSTNHSEYCAASKAAREAKWLDKIFSCLNYTSSIKPIQLFSDSQGAIAMAYNPVHREASKHVNLADHYVREQVDEGTILITYVPTAVMLADALTKALPKTQFLKLILSFMVD